MDRAILRRVEKQAWFHKYPRGLPSLLFGLTCVATIVAVIAIERADGNARQLELERNAGELAASLEQRGAENIAYLSAAATVISRRDELSPEAFAEFAGELNSRHDERGALGMGWAKLLKASAVARFERSVRSAGITNFTVHPSPKDANSAVVPIVYLEPQNRANREAVGFDMASEKIRRAALDLAVQTARPTVTGKVRLVQDDGEKNQFGFLIYIPVVEERSGTQFISGFVYSPIRAREFLASAVATMPNRGIEATIFDRTTSADSLLATRRLPGENGTSVNLSLKIGDRKWMLTVADKKPDSLSNLSRLTLLFGLVVAAMLAGIGRLITKRAAEDRQALEWLSKQSAIRTSLTRELNHRVKNTLANVLSIVSLTRHRTDDIDDFADGLIGRIRALSATHDLLSQSDWDDAPVDEIVRNEVAPYLQDEEDHIVMKGPATRLAPNDALSLGLAVHELVTNAAKYGALTTPEGRAHVSWRYRDEQTLEFNWRESGGPTVSKPEKRGFGMDLLERVVSHELNTKVELRFEPGGLICTLFVPVRARKDFSLRSES